MHVVRQGDARERGPSRGWAAAVAVKEARRDSRKGAVGAAAGGLRVCLGDGFGYHWVEVRGLVGISLGSWLQLWLVGTMVRDS